MKAPFPWFGGKSRVAHLVWERFGDVANFVEPFFGSGAVLLNRPHAPRCETVNDLDCYLANFWRALQADPLSLAAHADWPINEADLHARHAWLSGRQEFRERMKTDPDFFDVKIAGWWVWGLSQWIGGGWCSPNTRLDRANGSPRHGRPALQPCGVHATTIGDPHWQKRPQLKRGGLGVQRTVQQKPHLSGDSGAYGRGIHACGLEEKTGGLIPYFNALAQRLRRVRVCCGNWDRILGPAPTTSIGLTAVFLDPPYSEAAGRAADLYTADDLEVAHQVRAWAINHGQDPLLRIALCGYESEHAMPENWTVLRWSTPGGYGNQNGQGNNNRRRERIWFSPHCLQPNQPDLPALLP